MTPVSRLIIGDIMPKGGGTINPLKFNDEIFDLYSIPAYDSGTPDVVPGNEIGSIKQIVQPGDVLLSKIVPHIRRCWVVDQANGRRQIASGEWIIFRSPSIDTRYLRHFLLSNDFHAEFMRTVSGVGGSLLRARPTEVAKIGMVLPPLKEQRRLAAILDKADAIRRKRREALKLADEFLRVAFLDLFGDPVANPKNWDQRTLEQVVRPGTSITYGIVQAGPHVEKGIPYIRTGDFKNGELQSHGLGRTAPEIAVKFQRSRVEEGDLVYCIRASIGSVDVVPRELDGANLTQGTARIACGDKIHNEFLKWQLRTSQFGAWIDRHSKGATFKEITLETLRNAPVIVPPLPLQQRFVSLALTNNRLIQHQRTQLDAASDCFTTLSHRAFQGTL